MSDKRQCPACETYSSSVLAAFQRGEGCPQCGLSADAAEQLLMARARGATAELVEMAAKAEARAQAAEAEASELRATLAQIGRLAGRSVPG